MLVTDLDIAFLREQIAGEDEVAQRAVADQIAAVGDLSGLGALVHAAFVIAARRHFAPAWTRAGVIQYVAHVRAMLAERPGILSPSAAEDELKIALGDRAGTRHQAGEIARARLLLLIALVVSLDLDDDGTSDLLDEARSAAEQVLADRIGTD